MDTFKATRIQKITQSVIEHMGFKALITLRDTVVAGQGEFICNIKIEGDSNLLIGQHGINLQALQHIVRLIAKKEFGEQVAFSLDVNSYWEQKSLALAKEAEETAEGVTKTRESIAMRPMAGYERRIVHAVLADNPRVITESAGLGASRKIVVKPAPILE